MKNYKKFYYQKVQQDAKFGNRNLTDSCGVGILAISKTI